MSDPKFHEISPLRLARLRQLQDHMTRVSNAHQKLQWCRTYLANCRAASYDPQSLILTGRQVVRAFEALWEEAEALHKAYHTVLPRGN